jgi:hypothetical protein
MIPNTEFTIRIILFVINSFNFPLRREARERAAGHFIAALRRFNNETKARSGRSGRAGTQKWENE